MISIDDPLADDVRELLERHLEYARANTAPEEVYALEVDALLDPAVTFFSYRVDGSLLGVAALKRLDDAHAEIKSMHTAEAARSGGIGRAMVDHLLAVARDGGYRRVSLETGAGPAFAPARNLYARAGFTPCEPFGDYRPSPNSVCMALALDGPRARPQPAARPPAS
jgi:putative acetyltransferase